MDNIEPSRIEISLAPNGEIRIWLRRASASSAGNKLDSDVVLFSLKASDLLSAAPNTAVSILGARVLAAMAHLGEQSLGHMGYGVLNEQANALDEKQLLERVA